MSRWLDLTARRFIATVTGNLNLEYSMAPWPGGWGDDRLRWLQKVVAVHSRPQTGSLAEFNPFSIRRERPLQTSRMRRPRKHGLSYCALNDIDPANPFVPPFRAQRCVDPLYLA
jgi:hypothetical protein